MRDKIRNALFFMSGLPVLFQVGCVSAADVQAIAEGQFISFVNALINSVTSDLISGVIGG